MNKMLKGPGACGDLLGESKFETFQLGRFKEKSFEAQLGAKLRKTFVLPSANTEPAAIRLLLQQIEAKFDGRQ